MNLKELQKENLVLNQEIDRLKKENELLRESLLIVSKPDDILTNAVENDKVKIIFTMKQYLSLQTGVIDYPRLFVPKNMEYYVELSYLGDKIGFLGGADNGTDKADNQEH